MLVKPLSCFVFGLNDDRENAEIGPCGTYDCIRQKSGPKPLALMVPVHRKPAQQRGRNDWITREFLRNFVREQIERDTSGR